MYNLQGIIRKNIVNSNMQFEKLGYVTTNVSNYSTNGYKPVRFEALLSEDGYLTGEMRTDFSPGSMRLTQRPYDIAIEGAGFIPVTSENGEVTYTRDGSMKVDKDGYLVTNDGHIIGDGIKIPVNHYQINIKRDGTVESIGAIGNKPEVIGKIPIVNFQNPEGLKLINGNKYAATQESGEPVLIKQHELISQGFLETSGTNMYASVNDVLRLNASMIASSKLVKVVDDMYYKAINLNE